MFQTKVWQVWFALALALSVVAACDSQGGDSGESAGEGDEALPEFEGPLTGAALTAAADAVNPFDEWDGALARLHSLAGEPTHIDGDDHYWAVVENDTCAELSVENMDGQVGTVAVIDNIAPNIVNQWASCAEHAGHVPEVEAEVEAEAPASPPANAPAGQ